MAKASSKVTKTSGQGVSRYSYQKGYSLGNRGTAPPGGAVKDSPSSKIERSRSSKAQIDKVGGLNISYGDTLSPTDLKDLQGLNNEYAKNGGKTKGFSLLKAREYKGGKGDAGFLKERKK